jgi:predicted RNase H-like HicB family nuclease
MTYTAVYERDPDGRWVVEIPQVPGCHSYGRTIDQARERVQEALGLFVDDAEHAEIKDDVRLPESLRRQLQTMQQLRAKAAKGEVDVRKAQLKTLAALKKLKLGHRDTGRLLGVSFQRVHQLLTQSEAQVPGAVIERESRPRAAVSAVGSTRQVSRRFMRRATKKR